MSHSTKPTRRAIGFAQIRAISVQNFWTLHASLSNKETRNSRMIPILASGRRLLLSTSRLEFTSNMNQQTLKPGLPSITTTHFSGTAQTSEAIVAPMMMLAASIAGPTDDGGFTN